MIHQIITDIKLLKQKCLPVIEGEDINQLIQDLRDTLATQHGYGLSAIQIGVLKQVALYRLDNKEVILINPSIREKSERVTKMESCLSFPGIWILVDIYQHIVVKTKDGEFSASDLEAQIIQHEITHLNGITIFQRKHKAR